MLKLIKVNKYFHKRKKNQIHVIDNTSLELGNTGLVALLGDSGCGKTTLLNAIGGLDKIKSGSIYIDEEKISSRWIHKVDRIRNLHIGYIFQDYKLIDYLSVYDNVAIVLKMLGIKNKQEIKERVEYVLECVGMLRYQRRPAGMLSGGERQRVGIARAIVKNPSIILADEPTGNLDSKNTLEIMNIIKAISKNRLVILVTHEQNLASFYADRIIRVSDGKVISDEENTSDHDLDYELDNCFYLKDFKHQNTYQENNTSISLYQNEQEPISLQMVVKNGNIYIKSNTNIKVEAVDETRDIEFIDKHYQKMAKNKLEEYQFDFSKLEGSTKKKRYASIMNPISSIKTGFLKVLDYPILKKILLLGFFLTGMFIMYSTSSIAATLKLHKEDFIIMDDHYLIIEKNNFSEEEYLEYQTIEGVDDLIPGNSLVSFKFPFNDYYQVYDSGNASLSGSLVNLNKISKEDLIMGTMPENNHEIVIDALVAKRMMIDSENYQMAGITKTKDFLNRKVTLPNLGEFKITGITNQTKPNIYANESILLPIVLNNTENIRDSLGESNTPSLVAYSLYQNKITIKKGRAPQNDNEIIVNIQNEENMPLNKEIKISDKEKRVVVGYYTSADAYQYYFTTDNAILKKYLTKTKYLAIYPSNEEKVLSTLKEKKLNVYNSYQKSLEEYQEQKRESNKTTLIVSGVMLLISFIEIFLMIRSSFLSRVKEVGIYRAIGVKRRDIYQMFSGEIIAITTLAGLPGLLLMAYILYVLSGIKYLSEMILVNPLIVILAIALTYFLNLIIGLFPIYNTIRKRPAEILSRYDID